MKFDILTIFPSVFDSYFGESILKRAQEAGLIEIAAHDLRQWTTDKHHKVDDTPYGGGAGMVLKVEPLFKAIHDLKESGAKDHVSDEKTRVILFSAKGKRIVQEDARRLAGYERLIFICGRYEGVDERVTENLVDEESAEYESHTKAGVLEHPQYTKPEEFNGWRVPEVLLSGNHAEIEKWRKEHSKSI